MNKNSKDLHNNSMQTTYTQLTIMNKTPCNYKFTLILSQSEKEEVLKYMIKYLRKTSSQEWQIRI